MAALTAAAGLAATRLYLEQNAYIRNLAKHIVDEQGSENDVLSKLLAAPPHPWPKRRPRRRPDRWRLSEYC